MIFRNFRLRGLPESAEVFFDLEFKGGSELNMSVYQACDADLEQIVVEHYANASLRPPAHGSGVDLSGYVDPLIHQPVSGAPFSFTANAHHEFTFSDLEQLRNMVNALYDDIQRGHVAHISRSRAALKECAKRARLSNSVEWTAFLAHAHAEWDKFSK